MRTVYVLSEIFETRYFGTTRCSLPYSNFLHLNSILDADEDDQIAAAIRASLVESKKDEKKNTTFDSDVSEEDDESLFDNVESFSADNSNSAFQTRLLGKEPKLPVVEKEKKGELNKITQCA